MRLLGCWMEAHDPGQGDHDVSWVDLAEEERFNAAKTKTLNPCKKNYCSPKGELLALMHGLKKFAHVLPCQHHTRDSHPFIGSHQEEVSAQGSHLP